MIILFYDCKRVIVGLINDINFCAVHFSICTLTVY